MQLTLPAVTFGSYAEIDVAWQRSVAFQVNAGGGSAEILALLSGCTGEFSFPKSAGTTNAIYSLNGSNVLNKYTKQGGLWKIDSAFTPVYSCSNIYNGGDGKVVVLRNGSILFPEKNPSNLYFSGVKSVSIAQDRILVLRTDGTAGWCNLSNFYSTPEQPDPTLTAISFGGSVVSASIGYWRRSNSGYNSDGYNYYGVKADNTVLSVLSGGGVAFSGKATQVDGGWEATGNKAQDLLLREDGTLIVNDLFIDSGGSPSGGYNPLSISGVAAIATGYNHSIALMADGSVRTWGFSAPTIPSGYNHSFISIRAGCFTRSDGTQFLYSHSYYSLAISVPEDLRFPLFARNTRPTRVYDGSLVDLGEAAQITFGPAQPSNFYLDAGSNGTTVTSVTNVGSYTLGALDSGYSVEDVILTITPGVPIIDSNQSAVGKVGVAFSKTFSLLGGTNRPVTSWVATGLPAGLAINATTGAITGTPVNYGSTTITLTATGPGGTDTETAIIWVDLGTPIIVAGQSLAGKVGDIFSATPVLDNEANRPVTLWSAGGLPSGLWSNVNTGEIAGTPTANGTFPVNLTLTGPGGVGAARSIAIVIAGGVPIITAGQSAAGKMGVAFSKTFSLTDSLNRPVSSWAAAGLPAGLSINAITGAITGTPSAVGDSVITLSATGGGETDTETATISITGRPVSLEPIFEIICNVTADVDVRQGVSLKPIFEIICNVTADVDVRQGVSLEPIFEIICNVTAEVYANVVFAIDILEDSIIDFEIRGVDTISVNLRGVCEMDANGSWELYRDFGAFFGGAANFQAKFIARDVLQFAWGEFDLAKDFRGEIFLNCYTTIRGRVTPTPFAEVGLKLLDSRFDAELYRDVEGVESRPFDLTPASAQGVRDGVVPVLQSKERVVYNVWAAQMPPPGVQVHLSVYLKRSSSACASMLEEVADLNWQAGSARTVKYAEWDLCAAVPVRCQASAAGWQPGQNAVPYPFMFLQTNQVASGCLPASRLERGEGIDSQDLIFERGGIPVVNNTVSESHCVTPWLPDAATVCYGVVFTQSSCDCCVEEEDCKTTLRSAVGSKPLVWSEWVPSEAAYCPSDSVKQTRYELNGCAEDQAQTVPGTIAAGAWGPWGPLASAVCLGVPFQQVRVDASGCSAPQPQSATGTMSPVWSEWSPAASSVCSGETFQQTRQDQNGCAIPQSQSATGTRSCSCSNSVSDESIYCRGFKFTCCGNGYAHTNRGCVYIGPAGYCGDAANQK